MHTHDQFRQTRWSLVSGTQSADLAVRRAALDELCQAYWTPLYAFSRRRGNDEHDAMDLVQDFLVQLLDRGGIEGADPEKGRFRSYLIGAFEHFVAKQSRRATAQKRGGGVDIQSFDLAGAEQQYSAEVCTSETPERAFDRQFALATLDRCLARLRTDYVRRGRGQVFTALAPFLGSRPSAGEYGRVARALGIPEMAIKVTVHRMRDRLRRLLLAEVAQTLTDPREIEEELRELFSALEKPEARP